MMFDFYIDSADCLIHYDIPANKGTFSLRFSVLQDLNNVYIVSTFHFNEFLDKSPTKSYLFHITFKLNNLCLIGLSGKRA